MKTLEREWFPAPLLIPEAWVVGTGTNNEHFIVAVPPHDQERRGLPNLNVQGHIIPVQDRPGRRGDVDLLEDEQSVSEMLGDYELSYIRFDEEPGSRSVLFRRGNYTSRGGNELQMTQLLYGDPSMQWSVTYTWPRTGAGEAADEIAKHLEHSFFANETGDGP